MVDAATATTLRPRRSGRTVTILFEGIAPEEFTISGIAGFGDADNLGGATLAAVRDRHRPAGARQGGRVRFHLGAGGGGHRARAARGTRSSRCCPQGRGGHDARRWPTSSPTQLKEGLGFFRIALLVFASIALFVGSFIIFNTFSIIVAQRGQGAGAAASGRRQPPAGADLGRHRGARASDWSASVLGIVAGIGIAVVLKALLSAFGIDLPSTSLQLAAAHDRGRRLHHRRRSSRWSHRSCPPAAPRRWRPIEALRDIAGRRAPAGLGRRLVIGADRHGGWASRSLALRAVRRAGRTPGC